MSIFDKLVEERKARRVTQRIMAKHLKCTPSTLNKYEKGKRRILACDMEEYANYLGLELKLQVKD
jgi:transcriptional regulator with XRE-family HTH domain